MRNEIELTVSIDGVKQPARLFCESNPASIDLVMGENFNKTYKDIDFYKCFGKIRKDNPDVKFLCKGSKLNVHPSSMSSQMTNGLKAYELTMGKKPSFDDVVYIFEYDDENLTNDPEAQRAYFMQWIKSEKE
ncbi:hypothetical protein QIW53_06035 [Pseudomonas fluorescens]|uniref:hypothetical protein n=1 Tax=Pseudomonas fluorescens TaxID=294 RepID=UPI003523375A